MPHGNPLEHRNGGKESKRVAYARSALLLRRWTAQVTRTLTACFAFMTCSEAQLYLNKWTCLLGLFSLRKSSGGHFFYWVLQAQLVSVVLHNILFLTCWNKGTGKSFSRWDKCRCLGCQNKLTGSRWRKRLVTPAVTSPPLSRYKQPFTPGFLVSS